MHVSSKRGMKWTGACTCNVHPRTHAAACIHLRPPRTWNTHTLTYEHAGAHTQHVATQHGCNALESKGSCSAASHVMPSRGLLRDADSESTHTPPQHDTYAHAPEFEGQLLSRLVLGAQPGLAQGCGQ